MRVIVYGLYLLIPRRRGSENVEWGVASTLTLAAFLYLGSIVHLVALEFSLEVDRSILGALMLGIGIPLFYFALQSVATIEQQRQQASTRGMIWTKLVAAGYVLGGFVALLITLFVAAS